MPQWSRMQSHTDCTIHKAPNPHGERSWRGTVLGRASDHLQQYSKGRLRHLKSVLHHLTHIFPTSFPVYTIIFVLLRSPVLSGQHVDRYHELFLIEA